MRQPNKSSLPRNLGCNVCKRTFVKNEHLIRHRRTHTLERPFVCQVCNKSYARRDTLRRHEQLHENDNSPNPSHDLEANDSSRPVGQTADIINVSTAASNLPICSPYTVLPDASISQVDILQPQPVPVGITDFATNASDLALQDFQLTNLDDIRLPQTFDLDLFADWLYEPAMDETPYVASCQPRQSQPMHNGNHRDSGRANEFSSNTRPSTPWFSQATFGGSYHHTTPSRSDWRMSNGDRSNVQHALDTLPPSHIVPSISFFNRCIGLYIENIAVLLPIVYLPLFQPSQHNAWLLVAMLSLGSQLVGTKEATTQGEHMYDSLHRSVVGSWITFFDQARDPIVRHQAVLLGRAFALLSAKPRHIITARAFQNTIGFCIDQSSSSFRNSAPPRDVDSHQHSLEVMMPRLDCAIRILNAELAALCHDPPVPYRRNKKSAAPQSDRGFRPSMEKAAHYDNDASNTEQDVDSVYDSTNPTELIEDIPALWIYAELSDVLHAVMIRRSQSIGIEMESQELEQQLLDWHAKYEDVISTPVVEALHLLMLWHSIWLAIVCDLDLLEIALGRDGHDAATKWQAALQVWAGSVLATRATMHAFAIKRMAHAMTLDQVSAFHVPRCIYQAGLVLFGIAKLAGPDAPLTASYARSEPNHVFGTSNMALSKLFSDLDLDEMNLRWATPLLLEEQALSFVSLTRRSGPWGLCQNLADTLERVSAYEVSG